MNLYSPLCKLICTIFLLFGAQAFASSGSLDSRYYRFVNESTGSEILRDLESAEVTSIFELSRKINWLKAQSSKSRGQSSAPSTVQLKISRVLDLLKERLQYDYQSFSAIRLIRALGYVALPLSDDITLFIYKYYFANLHIKKMSSDDLEKTMIAVEWLYQFTSPPEDIDNILQELANWEVCRQSSTCVPRIEDIRSNNEFKKQD